MIAEEIADRIGIMHCGRLRFLGTVGELRQELASHQTSLESLFLELTDGSNGRPKKTAGEAKAAIAGEANPSTT